MSHSPATQHGSGIANQNGKSRRQRMVSGYSLMARGEPFVWLSGGMMVVCLSMLVLLLSIILWQGLLTFWPRPVRLVPLHDGTLVAGEWQWDEAYTPSNVQESTDLEPTSSNASQVPKHRQFLRTGCAEFYGKHFRYIDDSESVSGDHLLPSEYWSIERRKGGRFYGLMHQLREDFSPLDDPVLRSIQWLRSNELNGGSSTNDQVPNSNSADSSQSQFAWLDQLHQDRWKQAYQRWVSDAPTWAWEYTPVAMDSAAPAPQGAFRTISDNTQHPECLTKWLRQSNAWHRQAERFQRMIAAEDRAMNKARLAVRYDELAANADWSRELESRTRSIVESCERCDRLRRTVESLDVLLSPVVDPANSPKIAVATSISVKEREELTRWRERIGVDLDKERALLAPLVDTLPPELNSVTKSTARRIRSYFSIVHDATKQQLIWKEKLLQIETQQSTLHAVAAIPSLDPAKILAEKVEEATWAKLQTGDASVLTEIAPEFSQGITVAKRHWGNSQGDLWSIQSTSTDQLIWMHRNQNQQLQAFSLTDQPLMVANVVRGFRPNSLSLFEKLGIYGSRWWEFVSEDPRDANTEGGVFPAIWGTIVMTLIMSLVVVPFGVMASLYLREYAKAGPLVSLIRICINNLAGVPSIVYGVFGLAFFCYTVGGFIDGGPKRIEVTPLPSASWYLLLAVLAVIGFVAFFFSLKDSAWMKSPNDKSTWKRTVATCLWLTCTVGVVYLIAKSPFFDGFYQASLPTPTYGKGALVWAAMTLALLTLPVVIVATEEALSAVPNSLREGSYACGASKWQTIYRIVLPHARPGIMTGSILAMARGAGEVAPLMLVGAIPSALDLPLDTEFPFFHGSRSFMHLGFQIYSMGFQSQNSEAARPMVFTTTLLLIMIVAMLNFVAIWLRARLRKSFAGSQF